MVVYLQTTALVGIFWGRPGPSFFTVVYGLLYSRQDVGQLCTAKAKTCDLPDPTVTAFFVRPRSDGHICGDHCYWVTGRVTDAPKATA